MAPSAKQPIWANRSLPIAGPRQRGQFRKARTIAATRNARSRPPMLDNASIAELFTIKAQSADGHRELAYIRAAHEAFMLPEEAAAIVKRGGALTDLAGIGL